MNKGMEADDEGEIVRAAAGGDAGVEGEGRVARTARHRCETAYS